MELDHGRVAGLQHLEIELGGDRLDVVGREPGQEAVHDLAPAPEVVARGSGALGEARERALEGMAVEIGHAGEDEAVDPFSTCGRSAFAEGCDAPAGVDLDHELGGPAGRQEGAFGEETLGCGHRGMGSSLRVTRSRALTYPLAPGRESAACLNRGHPCGPAVAAPRLVPGARVQ